MFLWCRISEKNKVQAVAPYKRLHWQHKPYVRWFISEVLISKTFTLWLLHLQNVCISLNYFPSSASWEENKLQKSMI